MKNKYLKNIMKGKFFDFSNAITWLKSVGTGIVAMLVTCPLAIGVWYVRPLLPAVGMILGLAWIAAYALAFGFFAKKFWHWN